MNTTTDAATSRYNSLCVTTAWAPVWSIAAVVRAGSSVRRIFIPGVPASPTNNDQILQPNAAMTPNDTRVSMVELR